MKRLFDALDATWAPAELREADGWRFRRGDGGGQRVSAATALEPCGDISAAAEIMRGMAQAPIFMVRPGEERLDADLEAAGYGVKDPVSLLASAPDSLSRAPEEGAMFFEGDGRLALQEEIWAAAGIGPSRLAVMDRVAAPKRYLLGRFEDAPAGTAFMAVHGSVAMLHALEILPRFQRKGVGAAMMRGAATVAAGMGADLLAVLVVRANAPATGLYSALGMREAAGYHYRVLPE